MNKAMEERHLAQADKHITDGEIRISEQLLRIEHLKADGHDTTEANRMLTDLEDQQKEFEAHRQMIVDRLAQ
jgi:hypothetical protein